VDGEFRRAIFEFAARPVIYNVCNYQNRRTGTRSLLG
jgi:Zn-dependent oligopeptidase